MLGIKLIDWKRNEWIRQETKVKDAVELVKIMWA